MSSFRSLPLSLQDALRCTVVVSQNKTKTTHMKHKKYASVRVKFEPICINENCIAQPPAAQRIILTPKHHCVIKTSLLWLHI